MLRTLTHTLSSSLGNISLLVACFSCAACVFIVPAIVIKIGEKWALVVGGALMTAYLASIIKVNYATVVIFSIVLGLLLQWMLATVDVLQGLALSCCMWRAELTSSSAAQRKITAETGQSVINAFILW